MSVSSRFAILVAALVLLGTTAAAPVLAQGTPVVVDTLNLVGRSAVEDGYLSLMNMDRLNLGPRLNGMGGAGLAIAGGSEFLTFNPASLLGMTRLELQAEASWLTGGAGVNDFPRLVQIGDGQFLDTSGYRVSPSSSFSYASLTFGSPVTLLGGPGAFSLAYSRVFRTGRGDESRVEVVGPVTNNLESTYGLGLAPEYGVDAISGAIARQFGRLDFGANLNFRSGTLKRNDSVGITNFGFQILGANTSYEQKTSAFNVDLGARADLGKLDLGGVIYIGHTLDFNNGSSVVNPLPDPLEPTKQAIVFYDNPDHEINVPTMVGLGGSYQLTSKLLVAVDYWFRPWSSTQLTRPALEPVFGFVDPADSSTFVWTLTEVEGQTEEVALGYDDTNSFRIGFEYIAVDKPGLRLPLRLGFRTEKLTRTNVVIPDEYTQPDQLVLDYWRNLQPDGDADEAAVQAGQIANLLEHNIVAFTGTAINTSVISVGMGVGVGGFSADLGVQFQSYTFQRFFLDDYDPLTNPLPPTNTDESRNLMTFSIGARWQF